MADYLKILTEDIHSADIATPDKNGRPITRIIDIMFYDDQGIYFLTAKGKEFYRQLMEQKYISLPAVINQNHCLHCGKCFEICPEKAIVKGAC